MMNPKSQNNLQFEQVYNSLNSNQKLAVDSIEGAVLVVAGPGTGKTQILSTRIANILQKTDANPENILCITFTESGAKEMRERIQKIIGRDAHKITITTFHGFCNDVIQENSDNFAFFREQKQLDPLNQFKIIKQVIDETADLYIKQNVPLPNIIPFHDRYYRLKDITKAIQMLKKEAYSPELFTKAANDFLENLEANPKLNKKTGKPTKDYLENLKKAKDIVDLSKIYELYQKHLIENGLYDFDDMIMKVIAAFENDDLLLAKYQERFLYIHVDEFQDTNGVQSRIVDLLANFDSNPNLFVVGDDDQAIYRFQGASLDNILSFRKKYPESKVIPITQNYRSNQNILNAAMNLIEHNNSRLTNLLNNLSKELQAQDKSLSKVCIVESSIEEEENIWIAKKIKELKEQGVDYNNIAIIYRKNSHAENINNILSKLNIPTKIDVNQNLFEFESVNNFVLLLKAIAKFDKTRDLVLYQLLQKEFWNIDAVEIYKLNMLARKNKVTFEEQCLNMINGNISFDNAVLNEIFKKIINWHKKSYNSNLMSFLENVIYESGIIDWVMQKDESPFNDDSELSIQIMELTAIKQLFNYFAQQIQINPELTLEQLLDDIALLNENDLEISVPKIKTDEKAVSLLTAHGSKGMEFDYVFIIRSTESNWEKKKPQYSILTHDFFISDSVLKKDAKEKKSINVEDERSLFYVALTRAKKQIFITYAQEYVEQGNIKLANPTSFISEIEDKREVNIEKLKSTTSEITELVDLIKPKIQPDFSYITKQYLQTLVKDISISASTLNSYLKSPRQFLEDRILRAPTPKDKSLAMGTAVHWAIEKLNKFTLSGGDPRDYSLSRLLSDYKFMLEKELLGDSDFEVTLLEGQKYLSGYHESVISKGGYKNALESEFSFRNVKLIYSEDHEPIKLSGRIDKIESLDTLGTSGNVFWNKIPVKVIDFKTMAPKTENEIRGLTKSSDGNFARQLVFYKLLGDLDDLFRPHRSFANPKYDVQEVELVFLKPTNKNEFISISFHISESVVELLKMLIVEVHSRILDLRFPDECDLELLELAEKVVI